jgi:hypothetical protein
MQVGKPWPRGSSKHDVRQQVGSISIATPIGLSKRFQRCNEPAIQHDNPPRILLRLLHLWSSYDILYVAGSAAVEY